MTRSRLGPWWWLLAGGCLVALGIASLGAVRTGGYVFAAALALAGLARMAFSDDAVGALAIRSRALDVGLFLALASTVALIFSIVKLSAGTG